MRLLDAVRKRLDKRGYPPTHKLYLAVSEAYNAVHGLAVTAHYESCGSGVGDPPREPDATDHDRGAGVAVIAPE
jgi:hypothetical protein